MAADGPKCTDLHPEMRPPDILLLFTCFPYIMYNAGCTAAAFSCYLILL